MKRKIFSSIYLNSEFKTSYIQTTFRILSNTSWPPEIYNYMNKGSSRLDINFFTISPLQLSRCVIMGVMNGFLGIRQKTFKKSVIVHSGSCLLAKADTMSVEPTQ
jgi:hypothetical protein